MNNLKFVIGMGNTFTDVTKLLESITWSGRKGAAPRSIVAVLFNSEGYALQRAPVDVQEGQTCVLYENGKEKFRGLLMISGNTSSNRRLTLKAWDECIYLCNSKDSFSYKSKRADEIFVDCCKRAGLKVGDVANTGKVISEITKSNSTYWDVILSALSETYYATGRRYYVVAEKGKIHLRQRKAVSTMLMLEANTNTESYEYTVSIYDTRTRIKLVTSKNDTVKTYVNEKLEKKIGKFSEIQSVDKDATETELQQKIQVFKEEKSLVSKTLSCIGIGDSSVISGGCVYVYIAAIGIKCVMYVDEDTHTFTKDRHQMKLKLTFAADFKESSSSKLSGVSYTVTARSGLNVRDSPNGNILTAIPYGTTVISDGEQKSGWVHVQYNGTWGYSYGAYLKKYRSG